MILPTEILRHPEASGLLRMTKTFEITQIPFDSAQADCATRMRGFVGAIDELPIGRLNAFFSVNVSCPYTKVLYGVL